MSPTTKKKRTKKWVLSNARYTEHHFHHFPETTLLTEGEHSLADSLPEDEGGWEAKGVAPLGVQKDCSRP